MNPLDHLSMWGLVPLGFAVGLFGTLVGAGGGFILMPILVFLFPEAEPRYLTAISLAVIFCNALSGTLAYARMKLVDFEAGKLFVYAGVPGAMLGAYVTHWIQRDIFDPLFGSFLILVAIWLLGRTIWRGKLERQRLDQHGETVDYNRWHGGLLSFGVGILSSVLGIGGGVIHVPSLIYWLKFPPHRATATSHFVLLFTSLGASLWHLWHGELQPYFYVAALLAPGVIAGAQVGARLAPKVRGVFIIQALAVAMITIGIRILMR